MLARITPGKLAVSYRTTGGTESVEGTALRSSASLKVWRSDLGKRSIAPFELTSEVDHIAGLLLLVRLRFAIFAAN